MRPTKFLTALFGLGLFFACDTNDDATLTENLSATTVVEAINSIAFNEDLDNVITDGLNLSSRGIAEKTTTSTAAKDPSRFDGDKYGSCATVAEDEENNTKTITFDGDCNGRKGQTRSGTIVITYSEERDVVGAFHQVAFVDFYMNDVKIEGTRRKEVTAIDADGNKTVQSTYSNGKMVYTDGTFSTKSSRFTRYKNKTADEPYSTLSGSSEGVSTEGVAFSMTITTPITFLYGCDSDESRYKRRGKIPVEGVKVIDDGTDVIEINFGDGTCDTSVDVTTNGVLETVDLKDLKRGDRFRDLFKGGGRGKG